MNNFLKIALIANTLSQLVHASVPKKMATHPVIKVKKTDDLPKNKPSKTKYEEKSSKEEYIKSDVEQTRILKPIFEQNVPAVQPKKHSMINSLSNEEKQKLLKEQKNEINNIYNQMVGLCWQDYVKMQMMLSKKIGATLRKCGFKDLSDKLKQYHSKTFKSYQLKKHLPYDKTYDVQKLGFELVSYGLQLLNSLI